MWDPEEVEQKVPLVNSEDGKSSKLENDPNWKGVKLSGRGCKDVIFALLFILMFVGMLVVASFAFSNGDPSRLNPMDSEQEKLLEVGMGQIDVWLQEGVTQISQDYDVIIGGFVLAFLLALIWTQLIKMFTKVFIYVTLIGGIAAVIGLGAYVFSYGLTNGDQTMQIVSYVIWGIAFLLICVVIFLRKKIALTAALFTEACKGVQANPAMFLVALIITTLLASFITFWLASFAYLFSIPESTEATVVSFQTSVRSLMYFMVFGFFWTTALIFAMFQHSVAGGMAVWYFSKDAHDYDKIFSPSLKAFVWGFSTSFGSLAFGSLILAVVQFINYLMTKVQQANRKNKILVAIIGCIKCCLVCIQKIVKYVDKFAYIYIAMHGDSFCTSARNCFELLSRNLFSALAVDLIGDFVLFVGKLLGIAGSLFLTIVILDARGRVIHGLTMFIVLVIAYCIFTIFAHIIGIGVDAILVCYLEDIERSRDGNYHINPELHNLLQARTEKIKSSDN